MKAVILAGGLGTRISEETHLKPKPMIEIGGKPILWHILKMYSAFGVDDFVVVVGGDVDVNGFAILCTTEDANEPRVISQYEPA
jgi:NDP-sugar pyrophosphorylase family protein